MGRLIQPGFGQPALSGCFTFTWKLREDPRLLGGDSVTDEEEENAGTAATRQPHARAKESWATSTALVVDMFGRSGVHV